MQGTAPILPKYGAPATAQQETTRIYVGGDANTQGVARDVTNEEYFQMFGRTPEQSEQEKHMAAFHPEQFYGANIGSLQNVPLGQIAARYGTQFADFVQGYYTEHPTARFQAITGAYEQQQRNVIGTEGIIYQAPATPKNPYPENTAAGIAWLAGRQGGTVSESLAQKAFSQGYAGSLGVVSGISTVPMRDLSSQMPTQAELSTALGGAKTATFYVPYGEYTQIELSKAKALMGYDTGEIGIYQQVPGRSSYMLVSGGGRAAVQSGMFTIEKPETPYVISAFESGTYKLPSGEGLSRLGAEGYAGYVRQMDQRQIPANTAFSQYASSYNLANYVNPQGPNLGKAAAPGVALPWGVGAESPALSYVDVKGQTRGIDISAIVPTEQISQATGLPKPFISATSAAEVPAAAQTKPSLWDTTIGAITRMPGVIFGEKRESYMPLTVGMVAGGPAKIEEVGFRAAAPAIERIPLTTGAPVAFREILPYGQEVPGAAGPAAAKSLGAFWQEGAQIVKGAPKVLESAVYGERVPGAVSETAAKQLGAYVPEKIYELGAPLALVLTGTQAATVKAPTIPSTSEFGNQLADNVSKVFTAGIITAPLAMTMDIYRGKSAMPEVVSSVQSMGTPSKAGEPSSIFEKVGNVYESLNKLYSPYTTDIIGIGKGLESIPNIPEVGPAAPQLQLANLVRGTYVGASQHPLDIALSYGGGEVIAGGIGLGRTVVAKAAISEIPVVAQGGRALSTPLAADLGKVGAAALGGFFVASTAAHIIEQPTTSAKGEALGRAGLQFAGFGAGFNAVGLKEPINPYAGREYFSGKIALGPLESAQFKGETFIRSFFTQEPGAYREVSAIALPPRTIEPQMKAEPVLSELSISGPYAAPAKTVLTEQPNIVIGSSSVRQQYTPEILESAGIRVGKDIDVLIYSPKAALQSLSAKTGLTEEAAKTIMDVHPIPKGYPGFKPSVEADQGLEISSITRVFGDPYRNIARPRGTSEVIVAGKDYTGQLSYEAAQVQMGRKSAAVAQAIEDPFLKGYRLEKDVYDFISIYKAQREVGIKTGVPEKAFAKSDEAMARFMERKITYGTVKGQQPGSPEPTKTATIAEIYESMKGTPFKMEFGAVEEGSVLASARSVFGGGASILPSQLPSMPSALPSPFPSGLSASAVSPSSVPLSIVPSASRIPSIESVSPASAIESFYSLPSALSPSAAPSTPSYSLLSAIAPTPATAPAPAYIPSVYTPPVPSPTTPSVPSPTLPGLTYMPPSSTPTPSVPSIPASSIPKIPSPEIPPSPKIPGAGLLFGGGGLGGGRKRTRRFMEILPLGLDIGGWGRAVRGRRPGKAVKKKAAPAKGKSGRKKKR